MRNTYYLLLFGSVINYALAGILHYKPEHKAKDLAVGELKEADETPVELSNDVYDTNEDYNNGEELENIKETDISDTVLGKNLMDIIKSTDDDSDELDGDKSKVNANKELRIDDDDSNAAEENGKEKTVDFGEALDTDHILDDVDVAEPQLRIKRFTVWACPSDREAIRMSNGRLRCRPRISGVRKHRRPRPPRRYMPIKL